MEFRFKGIVFNLTYLAPDFGFENNNLILFLAYVKGRTIFAIKPKILFYFSPSRASSGAQGLRHARQVLCH